jgi:enoyl-CoA hydratase
VILLTGAGGKAFAAGADIALMAKMTPGEGESFAELAQNLTMRIEASHLPVIACVDGHALGGGCELAMACDLIYATAASKFGQPEVSLGLIPGFGGCVRLECLVGPARAKEMILTGSPISAQEALAFGLVNLVVADRSALFTSARATAITIAERSKSAVSLSKRAIVAQQKSAKERGLLAERAAFRAAFEHSEMHEGVAAFLEKRAPDFSLN